MSESPDMDDFDVSPPVHDSYDVLPSSEELSFKYNLVRVRHPTDQLKKLGVPERAINDIRFVYDLILTDASLMNIQPIQIREFQFRWRLIRTKTQVYFPETRTSEFYNMMDHLEHHYMIRLNMAKLGWRGDQTFEVHQRSTYDVKQVHEEKVEERIGKWKNRFKPREEGE